MEHCVGSVVVTPLCRWGSCQTGEVPCGRAQPGPWCSSYRPYKVVLRKVTRPGPQYWRCSLSAHIVRLTFVSNLSCFIFQVHSLITTVVMNVCFQVCTVIKALLNLLASPLGHDEVYVSVDTVSEVKSPTPRIFVLLVFIGVSRHRPKKLYQFPYPTNCVFSPYNKVLACNTEVIIVPILHSYCED